MTENSASALLKEKNVHAEASQNIIPTCTVQRPDPSKLYDSSWLKGTAADPFVPQRHYTNRSAPSLKADFSHPVYKKLSRINGRINSMHMGELIDSLKDLNLETSGKKEVLIRRLKNFHKQECLNKKVESDYDYVCVIDYEATCTESAANFNYPHEIIEFPIVLCNLKTLTIDAHFQAYCKPKINPKLTGFCKQLTGITQEQVDAAEDFPTVLKRVNDWFLEHGLGTKHTFTVAADGPWDFQKFLYMQCGHSEIPYPAWAQGWIDVRKMFSNWFGMRRCGIVKMLDCIGLTFEGNQHCGLDDSRNIARIMLQIASDGCRISNNSRLKDPDNILEKMPPLTNDSENQEN